jgi:hypothetical protein
MAEPLEYTDEVNPSWSETAVNTFEVAAVPDDEDPVVLDLDGRCPRCNDAMTHTHWLIAFTGVSAMDRDEALHAVEALRASGVLDKPLLPTEFSVQCSCQARHPDPLGREGLHGCGALWKMRFEAVDEEAM